MSDLEDDLLALAGGDDYESEEEVEVSKRKTSYDESDDEVLSKRRKLESEDEYEPEDIEDELVNPYPLEGKYKDQQDKYQLEDMDEIKREEILFERSQEMERYNEKKYLKDRMKRERMMTKPKPTRSSGRSKTSSKAGVRNDKLSELKKQREQATKRKARKYQEESEDEDENEVEEIDEDDELMTEESDFDDGIVAWGGKSKHPSRRSRDPSSLEDITKIQVGRTILSRYCYHPGFSDLVIDTFGRINLGIDKKSRKPIYRMVKIIDTELKPEKSYKLINSGNKTDLYIWVSQNRNQKKMFPITIFSDSPIIQEEYDRYVSELSKTNERIDYKEDVMEKSEMLQEFYNKGLSDQDINTMIERKQKIQQQKGNYTNYEAVKVRAQLIDELKILKQQGNLAEVKKVVEKLKDIEQIINKQQTKNLRSKDSDVMAKVNQRNRKLNNEIIRKAEMKNQQQELNSVTNGGDPFSRLKTNTRMFYQDLINESNTNAIKSINLQELIDKKAKQEEIIAKSTYRDLGEMDKLIKTIDFDIELVL